MLTRKERDAVAQWYSQAHICEEARSLFDAQDYEELEMYLHKTCLLPLSNVDTLPDYMRTEEGKPLFKFGLNPIKEEDNWKDAIEIGWKVVERNAGVSHDVIHKTIAKEQQDNWQAFLDSIERRKRERGQA